MSYEGSCFCFETDTLLVMPIGKITISFITVEVPFYLSFVCTRNKIASLISPTLTNIDNHISQVIPELLVELYMGWTC